MVKLRRSAVPVLAAVLVAGCAAPEGETLTARVVAVGIPGAGPVSVVGRFLPGRSAEGGLLELPASGGAR